MLYLSLSLSLALLFLLKQRYYITHVFTQQAFLTHILLYWFKFAEARLKNRIPWKENQRSILDIRLYFLGGSVNLLIWNYYFLSYFALPDIIDTFLKSFFCVSVRNIYRVSLHDFVLCGLDFKALFVRKLLPGLLYCF